MKEKQWMPAAARMRQIRLRRGFARLALLALTLGATGWASAQDFRASISGEVKDPSGASIPKASVVATSKETKETFPTVSDDAGAYTLPLLPIGDYSVRVSLSGFKTEVRTVTLHGGDKAELDFSLPIGSVSQTISVSSIAPLLEVSSGGSGQTISETQVHDLPLLGRNPFTLALLASGVTIPPGQAPSTSLRPFDNGGMDSFQINGSRSYSTEYSIDGLTDTAVDTGSPANLAFVPSPDMTAEFRVATSAYDAQYGRSGGGFISVDLKSGGNQFHGVAYDYIRNELFNANDYEDNRNGVRRSKFRWEQPGIEIDGPVIIPKIYDGRNKTFFMAGWEQVHILSPAPEYLSVPTALERTGDFSQSLNGGPLAIYDPLTTTPNGSGGYTRTAFSNSQIPTNRIDPVAKAILTYVPLPNLPGSGGALNLFVTPNDGTDTYNAYAYRLDHVFSPAQRISLSYLQSNRHQVQGLGGFPAASSPGYSHFRTNHGAQVDWTWVMSPTLTSNFRIGWIEHRFFLGAEDPNFPIGTLGFPSATVAGIYAPNLFPLIVPSGYSQFGNAGFGTGLINASDNYDLRETVLKTFSRHNLSFGGEIRPMRDDRQVFASNTTFSFGKDFTQSNPQASDSVSGDSYASFLLGYADGGSASTSPKPMYRYGYYALFVQDNWRVNSRLSLTAGLRWDTETPLVDQHHEQNVGFDPTATYGFAGQQLHGTLQYAGQGRDSASNIDFSNFGPRVGFAYSAAKRLVIRGGAGIIYAPTFDTPSQTGYSASTPYVASNDNLLTPANTLSNPFPEGFIQPAGAASNINGQSGWSYWPNHDRQLPRTTEFSLGFEYSLSPLTVFEAKYVGQISDNLPTSRNVNFLSVANLALGNQLNTQVPNPFAGALPGTFLNGPTYSLEQSLLPYPQYGSFSENLNDLSTDYNGLQLRLEKRLSSQFLRTDFLHLLQEHAERILERSGHHLDLLHRSQRGSAGCEHCGHLPFAVLPRFVARGDQRSAGWMAGEYDLFGLFWRDLRGSVGSSIDWDQSAHS